MKARLTSVAAVAATVAMGFAGVAGASAHTFKATKTGALSGHQGTQASTTGNQVFTSSPGSEVVCTTAATTGSIVALEAPTQKVEVKYGGCEAFGFIGAKISTAHYNISAEGSVEIESPITIEVEGTCTVTVSKQTVSKVSFKNEAPGIEETSEVKGIKSTSTSEFLCKAGNEGTYSGPNYIHGEEGNTLTWA